MAIDLRPSTELADLFTASYEGYFVPFAIDEPALAYMVDAIDIDFAGSLVAVENGTPVGLANLGRRGERTWVGGGGVVSVRRGAGIGEQLMRGVASARSLPRCGRRVSSPQSITRPPGRSRSCSARPEPRSCSGSTRWSWRSRQGQSHR